MNMKSLSLVVAVVCAGAGLAASEPPVNLWPEGKMPSPQANQQYAPYYVWHTPDKRTSDAVLISVSGGSYMGCGIEGFEVSPIRDFFLARGVTVVTMRYRTPRPAGLPKHLTAWQDAQRTVRLVRAEAKKRGLDPDKIGFTGCSAGGHLTLMVATSSETPAYEPVDAIDALPCNVNFAIPVYPAYGLVGNADRGEVEACNDLTMPLVPEFKFDASTPPMMLVHGDADGWTPMTSVRVYHKLRTMHIPAELRIMALEPHCFMADALDGTPAATWKDHVWAWPRRLHLTDNHPVNWSWRKFSGKLSGWADADPAVWQERRGVLSAEKDTPLWLKGVYENFILDFDYRLDPEANSGVILYASDRANWIPNSIEIQLLDDAGKKWVNDPPRLKNGSLYGHRGPERSSARPAGAWNHMTIWAEGRRVRVMVNGVVTLDDDLSRYTDAKVNPDGTPIPPWLSRPLATLEPRGSIGFQGKHGGAKPYFKNIRIKELNK